MYNKVPPEQSEEMRLMLIFLVLSRKNHEIIFPPMTRLQDAYKDIRLVKKCKKDKNGNIINSSLYIEKIIKELES